MIPDRVDLETIVSGKAIGFRASAIRGCLWLLKPIYRSAIFLRNSAYDLGVFKSHAAARPVVSIGNLTVGGTGKTPMVAWLASSLLAKGFKPAIVSRGYGGTVAEPNDEFKELQLRLPAVPHVQNSNRVAAVSRAIRESSPDLILLDDGFQHRRLKRDLDIVLVDCTKPFGYGHVLPRGLLREPIGSARRAHVIVLTRCDQVDARVIAEIKTRIASSIRNQKSKTVFAEVSFQPSHLLFADDQIQPLSELSNVQFTAFCGIGNPDAFEQLLNSSLGHSGDDRDLSVIRFPDHHNFDSADIARIVREANEHESQLVLCTVKDLVKAKTLWPKGAVKLGAIVIEAQFRSGQEDLLDKVVQSLNDR